MGKIYARCRTCSLWFSIGFESDDPGLEGTEAKSLACPNGHEHRYARSELTDESHFVHKFKRAAGRVYKA